MRTVEGTVFDRGCCILYSGVEFWVFSYGEEGTEEKEAEKGDLLSKKTRSLFCCCCLLLKEEAGLARRSCRSGHGV